MTIRSVSIDVASPAERRSFASEFLNLELPSEASDDEVSAQIQRAQPGVSTIFVQEAADVAEEQAPQVEPTEDEKARLLNLRPEERGRPGAGSLGQGDPRVKIMIPVVDSEDETGAQDVLVGVNGRAWQLRRGVELNIPIRVLEALQNASATIVRHNEEGEEVRRDAKRVPFQVLDMPSEAAVAKWHEDTDALFCA